MDPVTAAAVLLAGGLIGATGIGGVLVVPALTELAGLDLRRAIAASAAAFALPGLAALAWLKRDGTWHRRWTILLVGAVPTAVAGAAMVHQVDPRWLLGGVAALAFGSGARSLLRAWSGTPAASPARTLSAPALGTLGAGVGLGSAITGTGGPVLLVPALVMLRQPAPLVIAAAQAIQLPIALCAGASHWVSGELDLTLAIPLGLLLLAGSFAGLAVGRRLPVHVLQVLVSLLLVGVGLFFGLRLFAFTFR